MEDEAKEWARSFLARTSGFSPSTNEVWELVLKLREEFRAGFLACAEDASNAYDRGYKQASEDWAERCRAAEARVAKLAEWAHTFGKSLVPTGPDTYGEGVRACKGQVLALLSSKQAAE